MLITLCISIICEVSMSIQSFRRVFQAQRDTSPSYKQTIFPLPDMDFGSASFTLSWVDSLNVYHDNRCSHYLTNDYCIDLGDTQGKVNLTPPPPQKSMTARWGWMEGRTFTIEILTGVHMPASATVLLWTRPLHHI